MHRQSGISGAMSGGSQQEGREAGVTLTWKVLGAHQIALVMERWTGVLASVMEEMR